MKPKLRFLKDLLKIPTVFVVMAFLAIGIQSKALAKSKPTKTKGPQEEINAFYKEYLNDKKRSQWKYQSKLLFSRSFQELLERNHLTCKESAGTDVCGFGADGDIYLDSQESDPNLNFKNSKFSSSNQKPGQIKVRFNVCPSLKKHSEYYQRTILFKMKLENNRWVVDDIIYGNGSSARKMMEDELDAYEHKNRKYQ